MRLVGLVLCLGMLTGLAWAQEAPQPPPSLPATPGEVAHALTRADLEAWLDGMVPYALKSGHIAGAVVAVVQNGQVLLSKGYGYADYAARVPMDAARTMVRPGSTSKLFTWTAVMQLVEAGKIDLDRDVNTYLDFAVGRPGHPITMRDLMNHRGGFEEGLKGIFSVDPAGLESNEQYLKTHLRPLLFEPGMVPAYSNYGVSLAGYIVQRVSGEAFDDYVERHVFAPLGMTNTTFAQPPPARFLAAMSKGYRSIDDAPFPYELLVTRPAGSITTTADDMARFMLAQLQQGSLDGATILSPATTALMHSASEKPFAPGFSTMAHGFFDELHNGREVLGHGGDTVVFHSDLELIPAEKVGIYFTFNSRGVGDAVYGARQDLFDGFMDRYFPAPVTPAPAVVPSAKADSARIAGLYEGSRRVQDSFLAFFYLLQQTRIVTNADGTITAPDVTGQNQTVLQEVAPGIWQDVHGTRKLALTELGGVKTVVDSDDPVGVLQAVPFARSSTLNLPVLLFSVGILVWTLVLWVISPLLRRGDRGALVLSRPARRLRLMLRVAAAFDVVWLFGWFEVFAPVTRFELQIYNKPLDPVVLGLEVSGFVALLLTAVSFWSARSLFRLDFSWMSRVWSVGVLAGLVGVAWIVVVGHLVGVNLNY